MAYWSLGWWQGPRWVVFLVVLPTVKNHFLLKEKLNLFSIFLRPGWTFHCGHVPPMCGLSGSARWSVVSLCLSVVILFVFVISHGICLFVVILFVFLHPFSRYLFVCCHIVPIFSYHLSWYLCVRLFCRLISLLEEVTHY